MMSLAISALLASMGFEGRRPRAVDGALVFARRVRGLVARYAVLPSDARVAEIALMTKPGICQAVFYDEAANAFAKAEWLVFGGRTPLPTRACPNGAVPCVVIYDLISL